MRSGRFSRGCVAAFVFGSLLHGCGTSPSPPQLGDVIGSASQIVALFEDKNLLFAEGTCIKQLETGTGSATGTATASGKNMSMALMTPPGSSTTVFPAGAAMTCFLNADFDVIGSAPSANGRVTFFADLVAEGVDQIPLYSASVTLSVTEVATRLIVGDDTQSINFCSEGTDCDPLPSTRRLFMEVNNIDFQPNVTYLAQVQLSAASEADAPFGDHGGTLGLSVTVDQLEVGFD